MDIKPLVSLMIGELFEAKERKNRVVMYLTSGNMVEGTVEEVQARQSDSQVRIVHYQPGTNIEKGATVVRVDDIVSFRRNYG